MRVTWSQDAGARSPCMYLNLLNVPATPRNESSAHSSTSSCVSFRVPTSLSTSDFILFVKICYFGGYKPGHFYNSKNFSESYMIVSWLRKVHVCMWTPRHSWQRVPPILPLMMNGDHWSKLLTQSKNHCSQFLSVWTPADVLCGGGGVTSTW